GTWSTPAYFNGSIYYAGAGDALKMFRVSLATIATPPSSTSPEGFGYPGATPSISANGATNGIVWLIDSNPFWYNGTAVLHAFDAANVARELYNSSNLTADAAGPA